MARAKLLVLIKTLLLLLSYCQVVQKEKSLTRWQNMLNLLLLNRLKNT